MIAHASSLFLASILFVACGGQTISVLHTKSKPTGEGDAQLSIKNDSGASIEKIYVAKTEAADKAKEMGSSPGSASDEALWGDDQLGNSGIPLGHTWNALHLEEARYDLLLVAHDRREQVVKHLDLKSGGRYVLQVNNAWMMGR